MPSTASVVIIKGAVEDRAGDTLQAVLGPKDTFDARAVVHGAAGETFLAAEETLCHRIPQLIVAERADDAVHLASRLRDADPEDEQHWRDLLQTLVRTGRLLDARLEAEALDARRHGDGGALQPESAAMV